MDICPFCSFCKDLAGTEARASLRRPQIKHLLDPVRRAIHVRTRDSMGQIGTSQVCSAKFCPRKVGSANTEVSAGGPAFSIFEILVDGIRRTCDFAWDTPKFVSLYHHPASDQFLNLRVNLLSTGVLPHPA